MELPLEIRRPISHDIENGVRIVDAKGSLIASGYSFDELSQIVRAVNSYGPMREALKKALAFAMVAVPAHYPGLTIAETLRAALAEKEPSDADA